MLVPKRNTEPVATRGLEIILALFVGVVLAVGAFVALDLGESRDADTSTSPEASPSTTVPGVENTRPTAPRATPDEIIEVWERAYTSTYALEGQLEIHDVADGESPDLYAITSEPAVVIEVRRAFIDGRELDQVGDTALSIGPSGQRTCERSGTIFLCTDPEPAPTTELRLEVVRSRIDGNDADYEVWPDDGCWLAVAIEPTTSSNWGQVSRWCFDDATGALRERTTWRGARLERFVANEIRSEVTEDDLAPA